MPDESNAKEIAALDAIVAGILAGRSIEDLSDDEILKFCESCPPLSDSSRRILDRLGPEPFKSNRNVDEPRRYAKEQQFAGMYREGSDESIAPEVKQEIDRKREELRARLRAKNKGDV
jgi:hypothetical protein